MSSVVISGDSSGTITLSAPAVAGTNTITLPAATGTAVVTGTTPTLNGITFPATQVPSADANTLDDYEEGTFSPTIFGSSTAGTVTYGQQSGRYTKIGRLVQFELYIEYSSGTGTGFLRVGNLPFTVGNANTFPAISIGYFSLISLSANNVANGQCLPNTTNIAIEQYPTGGGSQNGVNYDANGGIVISGTYSV